MKKLLASLFSVIILATSLYSQQCIPVGEKTLKKSIKSIKSQKTDNDRLLAAERVVLGYCYTSAQMTDLAVLFDEDAFRAKFLDQYLLTISDPENALKVMDSFDKTSNALVFYETIRESIIKGEVEQELVAMSNGEFKEKFAFVKKEHYRGDQLERIRFFFVDEPLTLDQVEKLVDLFKYTGDQKLVLKLLYPKCVDKDNYFRFASRFKYEGDRESFLSSLN